MEGTLLKQITEEKQAFDTEDITIVNGYTFNQKKTIEKIYRFYNSIFENGVIDNEGDRKYFYNVVRNPCKVTTKMIDFDTKDIKIHTAAGGTTLTTWFYEKDLHQWMKENDFGKVLNRIFTELPIFGSVVLKVINGKPYFVDLKNFIVSEASANTLNDAGALIERHLYTPREFRKQGEKMGWDNIEKTIQAHRETKEPYIAVYERYGDVGEWKDNKMIYSYRRIYIADVGRDERDTDGTIIYHDGIVLANDTIKKHPYYEFHINKVAGRWLGVGVVESLFDIQTRQNEIANVTAKGTYWNALRIFQTRGTFAGQSIREFANGHVIDNCENEITPVNTQDPNLTFFINETQKWNALRDEMTLAYDVVQGERLPAGTPLGSAQIAASMAQSYFDQVREDIALDLKSFLYDVILPEFEKKNSNEHVIRLVGEDFEKIRDIQISQKTNAEFYQFIGRTGKIPTKEEYEFIKASVVDTENKRAEKLALIPKAFYKDIKYKLDIIITDENKDTRTMTQVYFAALQAITADPTVLTDRTKRKIFTNALENSGVNIEDLVPPAPTQTMAQLVGQTPMRGAGGGVSAPGNVQQTNGMAAETKV